MHFFTYLIYFNSLVTKDFSSNYTTFEFLCNKVKYFQFWFKILCDCLWSKFTKLLFQNIYSSLFLFFITIISFPLEFKNIVF